jgi:hypothetical protein
VFSQSPHPQNYCIFSKPTKGQSRLYCVFSKTTSPVYKKAVKTILCLLQAHIPTGWRGNQDYIVSSLSPHPHWMKGKSRLHCVFSKHTSPLDEGEIKTILCLLQAHIPTGWRGNQDYIVSSPSPHPHCMKGKSRLYCVFSKPTFPLDEGEVKTTLCLS